MYTTHFGFSEKPFKLKSDPLAFYVNADYESVYEKLGRGILKRRGLIALTGVAGTGKTVLLRLLMAGSDESTHFIVFSKSTLGFADILRQACDEHIADGDAADEAALQSYLLNFLQQQADDYTLVLVIDDAHNLDQETVDRLVQLYNAQDGVQPPLQILLVGLPELEAKLLRYSFSVRVQLKPLDAAEINKFIQAQLDKVGFQGKDLFPQPALQRIAQYSNGIPRNITALCDAALFIASLEGKQQVSPDMVDQAAQQCFLGSGKPLATGGSLMNFDVTPADVARVMSTPHPARDALRGSTIERLSGDLLYAAQSQPRRLSQPLSTGTGSASVDQREAEPAEPHQEVGVKPRPAEQTPAVAPKRSRWPQVAAALSVLLVLVGAGGATVYYRPALVGLDRTDLDNYIASAESYATEGVAQLGFWLDRAREQLAAWTGAPPAPEPPAPAAAPSPEPAASSPVVEATPTEQPSLPASAESPLSEAQTADIESGTAPAEVAESETAVMEPEATAPPDVAENSEVPVSVEPATAEPQTESTELSVSETPPKQDAGALADLAEPDTAVGGQDLVQEDVDQDELAQDELVQDPTPNPDLEQRLTELFARAERQVGQRRLTTPATDNALDTFLEILDLNPGNDAALNGIENIKNTYQQWAEAAARQNNWINARFYYQKALALDPDDSALQEALAALPAV